MRALNRVAAVAAAIAATITVSAASAQETDEQALARMIAGESAMQGKELDKALAAAAASPLGSRANPVRAAMPEGQRAYLRRLRCSNGAAPSFTRNGNVGIGPFGNFVDAFSVTCTGGEPATATVHMDMYHKGYAETRPTPGFTIAP